MKRFAGRACVVTASTAGIGFAIAERFAQEGGRVCVSSRQEQSVQSAVEKLRAIASDPNDVQGMVCNVEDQNNRKSLLEMTKQKFGSIDVLVLNAASTHSHFGRMTDAPEQSWDSTFNTNVKTGFLFCQEARPFFTKSAFLPSAFSTNVLFISSIGAYLPTNPIGIYCITKTTLLGLTKALANDLALDGIRVNCIAPGLIRTNRSRGFVDVIESKTPKEKMGNLAELADTAGGVMHRVGEPQEIGAVAAFLCSSDASYVTGEVVVAAGASPRL